MSALHTRPLESQSRSSLCVRTVRAMLALVVAAGCSGCGFDLEEPGLAPRPKTIGSEESPAEVVSLEVELNTHRRGLELAAVPLDAGLTRVAQLHVLDLEEHYAAEPCSLHSWSSSGPWAACCYRRDAPDVECMLNKPKELSAYPGVGYEIAVERLGLALTPRDALQAWLDSQAHRDVLENTGEWADKQWRAMGVAMTEHYAVVWFGTEPPVQSLAQPEN